MVASAKRSVPRHRTAINRAELSRPVRLALAAGIVSRQRDLFDYGCGRGVDVAILKSRGFCANGWDPAHRPNAPLLSADVVNLGFVVNVIERPSERSATLIAAFKLAKYCLIVSARLTDESRRVTGHEYADGLITRSETFQKLFDQNELRNWLESVTEAQATALAPGVFVVFRSAHDRRSFIANRFRRNLQLPGLRHSDKVFEENQELFEELMEFIAWRGRLPWIDEGEAFSSIAETVGSIRRAFRVVRNISDPNEWDRIAEERAQDLLIQLALSRFEGRPRFSGWPLEIRRDIRSFFSTYRKACELSDKLLFFVGDPALLDGLLRTSGIGKVMPTALYVHASALSELHPVLRIYEGCARNLIGDVEGANIIKLHRTERRVSYLAYADFDRDPHPALTAYWRVDLQSFDVKAKDYVNTTNRPILHRKEEFVGPAYPGRAKFAKLTAQEERRGLYANPAAIGTREAWALLVQSKGLEFRGHKLQEISGRVSAQY